MPGNLVNLTPAAIAKWPEPNYVHPTQRQWVTPVIALLYGIATLAIALRLWVRYRKQGGGLGIDDVSRSRDPSRSKSLTVTKALISASWLMSTGFTACGIIGVYTSKSNRHMWDIPVPLWEDLAMLVGIAEVFYLLTGGCIRISVLFFYRRLVEDSCSRRWRYAIIGAIIFTASWVIACTCAITFSCTPIDAYWRSFDPSYKEKYNCVDIAAVNYLVGTLSIVGDIYAVALPCIITWNFTMPRSQKIALNLVFGTSLLVVAVCCVRNYYLFRLSQASDFSWMITNINIGSQLEVQIATLCACAPALRVLFRRYFKIPVSNFLQSKSSGQTTSSTGSEAQIIQDTLTSEKGCSVDFASALAGRWSASDSSPGQNITPARSDFDTPQMKDFV